MDSEHPFIGDTNSGLPGKCHRKSLVSGHTVDNDIILFNNNNNVGHQKDLYELLDYTQVEGPWPIEHPLPLPTWAPKPKESFKLQSVLEYEELASNIELHVQKLLEEHNYNTVGNFIALYEGYQAGQSSTLREYIQS